MVCTKRVVYKRCVVEWGLYKKGVVHEGGVQKGVVQMACCIKDVLWKWALYKRGSLFLSQL